MSVQKHHKEIMNSEKYSRGRRGAPAKGVGRETGARVQIPLSPFICLKDFEKELQKKMKKLLTNSKHCDKISELPLRHSNNKTKFLEN